MASAELRQSSFAWGEIAPTLRGRQDDRIYQQGLRTARNVFITRHGAVVSRAGTRVIGEVEGQPRLQAFRFAEDVGYVLVLGEKYLEVILAQEFIESSPGTRLRVATPWSEGDTRRLKFLQSGNSILVTHPGYKPHEIWRVSDTQWELDELSFDLLQYGNSSGTPSLNAGGYVPALVEPVPGTSFTTVKPFYWYYLVTLSYRDARGRIRESAPHQRRKLVDNRYASIGDTVDITTTPWTYDTIAMYPDTDVAQDLLRIAGDCPVEIDFSPQPFDPAPEDQPHEQVGTNIYRFRGQFVGFLDQVPGPQTASDGNRFVDYGDEPDITEPPPKGTNPFKVFDFDGKTVLRIENPSCAGYWEDRLLYAGMEQRPSLLLFSKQGNYLDYDPRAFSKDTSPFDLPLLLREYEEIRSIVSGRKLVVFTSASVWLIGGAQGGILTATNRSAYQHSSYGASYLQPLLVEESILYEAALGGAIRDLVYSDEAQGYQGGDISYVAQHRLFQYGIAGWAHARVPHNLVLSTGLFARTVNVLQYQRGGARGWTWWDTGGGSDLWKDVCSVPEITAAGGEDAVYLLATRAVSGGSKTFVERMSSRNLASDYTPLDASGHYSGTEQTVIGDPAIFTDLEDTPDGTLSHLEGRQVYAVCGGVLRNTVQGPYTVVGGKITLDQPAADVVVGLAFECDVELLDIPQAPDTRKRVEKVILQVEDSREIWAGPDEDTLSSRPVRTVEDAWGGLPLYTAELEIPVAGNWSRGGRVFIRQRAPQPFALLSVVRVVEGGSK